MADEVTYVCGLCDRKVTVKAGEPVPECCGKPMEPLPFCMTVPQWEMARPDKDEPCDDATGQNRRK